MQARICHSALGMLWCVYRHFDVNWRYFDVPLIFLCVTTSGYRTCSHNDLQLISETFHFHDVHFYGFSISFLDSAQTRWVSYCRAHVRYTKSHVTILSQWLAVPWILYFIYYISCSNGMIVLLKNFRATRIQYSKFLATFFAWRPDQRTYGCSNHMFQSLAKQWFSLLMGTQHSLNKLSTTQWSLHQMSLIFVWVAWTEDLIYTVIVTSILVANFQLRLKWSQWYRALSSKGRVPSFINTYWLYLLTLAVYDCL